MRIIALARGMLSLTGGNMAEEEKKENWCLRQWKTLKDSLHNNRLAKKQGKENFKERERAYKRLLKEEKERIEKEGEYHPDSDSYLELHHVNKVLYLRQPDHFYF